MNAQERIAHIFRDHPSAEDGQGIRVNGVHPFIVGCDGRMVLAIYEWFPRSEKIASGRLSSISTTISWVMDDDRDALDIDAADLRAFVGPPRFDGDDETPETVREGVILGESYNLNRLSKLLIGITGPVRLATIPHMRMLSIRGVDFVACLMAYNSTDWVSLPVLE